MEKNNKRNSTKKAAKTDAFKFTKKTNKPGSGDQQYQNLFLVNRFPSGRNGKVVYIRPEYHERLLRIVQLNREDKTTLYSYIDNILEHHFQQFAEDITNYYNDKIKPIL